MSNRVLNYTIAISVAIHLLILGVIGRTSAARPIEVENLKLVKVDLVKSPDEIKLSKPDQPKPAGTKEIEPTPFVPPVKQMRTAPPPKPRPPKPTRTRPAPGPYKIASSSLPDRPAGNPGGGLDMGSTSDRGGNLGSTGGTSRPGYVPNPDGGQGVGSGTGPGVGTPDPPRHADPGPGTAPAPAPPPPRMMEVTVCSVSGLRPNRYCEKKTTRSFREDDIPARTCDTCKEPEPAHVNRQADRAEPELIHDPKVRIPESVLEEGIRAAVKIQYTVDADGGVSDVKVTDGSGNRELDHAVVEAARKMKYKPAVQDGVPRAVKKTRTYRIDV